MISCIDEWAISRQAKALIGLSQHVIDLPAKGLHKWLTKWHSSCRECQCKPKPLSPEADRWEALQGDVVYLQMLKAGI